MRKIQINLKWLNSYYFINFDLESAITCTEEPGLVSRVIERQELNFKDLGSTKEGKCSDLLALLYGGADSKRGHLEKFRSRSIATLYFLEFLEVESEERKIVTVVPGSECLYVMTPALLQKEKGGHVATTSYFRQLKKGHDDYSVACLHKVPWGHWDVFLKDCVGALATVLEEEKTVFLYDVKCATTSNELNEEVNAYSIRNYGSVSHKASSHPYAEQSNGMNELLQLSTYQDEILLEDSRVDARSNLKIRIIKDIMDTLLPGALSD